MLSQNVVKLQESDIRRLEDKIGMGQIEEVVLQVILFSRIVFKNIFFND